MHNLIQESGLWLLCAIFQRSYIFGYIMNRSAIVWSAAALALTVMLMPAAEAQAPPVLTFANKTAQRLDIAVRTPSHQWAGLPDTNGDGCLDIFVGAHTDATDSAMYLQDVDLTGCTGTFTYIPPLNNYTQPSPANIGITERLIWGNFYQSTKGLWSFLGFNSGPGQAARYVISDATTVSGIPLFNPKSVGCWGSQTFCLPMDLDGDGVYELATRKRNYTNPEMGYIRNIDTGALLLVPDSAGAAYGNAMAVFDVDNDGYPEVVHPTAGGYWKYNLATRKLNWKANKFSGPLADPLATGHHLAPFDYDSDGDEDLYFGAATYGPASDNTLHNLKGPNLFYIYLYRNNGDGTFTDVTGRSELQRALANTNYYTTHGNTVIADVNNDGYPDIVFGGEGTSHTSTKTFITFLINNGNGTFTANRSNNFGAFNHSSNPGGKPWIGAGDYNNDCKIDIVKTHGTTVPPAGNTSTYESVGLFENTSNLLGNDCLRIRVQGLTTDGMHSRIVIKDSASGRIITSWQVGVFTEGYSNLITNAGVGNRETVDVEVHFPHGGPTYVFRGVATNQDLIVKLDGTLVENYEPGTPIVADDMQENNPPLLTITSPEDGDSVAQDQSIQLTATAADAEDGDLSARVSWHSSIDGELGEGTFAVKLSPGAHTLTATIRDSLDAEAVASVVISVIDLPPDLSIVAPEDGADFTAGQLVGLNATANDLTDGNLNDQIVWSSSLQGNLGTGGSLSIPLVAGTHIITATVADSEALTDSATVTVTVTENSELPPDPADVAPPADLTQVLGLKETTEFLYTGANPIQHDVDPDDIQDYRVGIVRGVVLDRSNNPLSGVEVTIKDHPEFGWTLSRADGMFDMAVNGGGFLTVSYEKAGYLPVQRQVNVPWQDYVFSDDVVMIALDAQANVINLTDTSADFQVAQGSVQTDADGSRQATVLFPQGVSATMTLADGSTQALTTMTVRATEYTVGENGPEAMPGPLPVESGYTYAVELGLDEATAAGATNVEFDEPLPFYVDNFMEFPVGEIVPAGWYNRESASWVASQNGKVIKILSINNGLAELDVSGSGTIADAATLASLGITNPELEQLAALYPAGKSLWRTPITHFTAWDCNSMSGPPADAIPPPPEEPVSADEEKLDTEDSDECPGCIIDAQNQVLGEEIAIAGTGFSLSYRSDRVAGRKTSNTLTIPITGAVVPASLKSIDLEIQIAGQKTKLSFTDAPDQNYTFEWDGLDAYGRPVIGQADASVTISYQYALNYYAAAQNTAESFGKWGEIQNNGYRVLVERESQLTAIEKSWHKQLGIKGPSADGLGFWSINVHHTADPHNGIFYGGDGSKRSASGLSNVITTTTAAYDPDTSPIFSFSEVGPDGFFYVGAINAIQRRSLTTGEIERIAGGGVDIPSTFSGDGGDALLAGIESPSSIEFGPDGSIYFATQGEETGRVRKITPDGIIHTVAGGGTIVPSADPLTGQATDVRFSGRRIDDIELAPDGTLYILQRGEIYKVLPDGNISRISGFSLTSGFQGDGGPVANAIFATNATHLALGPDGSLFVADRANLRIRKISPSGIVTTVVGTGNSFNISANGSPALAADIGGPNKLIVDHNGDLYFSAGFNIFIVAGDGIVRAIAGTGIQEIRRNYFGVPVFSLNTLYPLWCSPENASATQSDLNTAHDFWRTSDGAIYFRACGLRKISPPLVNNNLSNASGTEIYSFDKNSLHEKTIDAISGTNLLTFAYTLEGLLDSVTDLDGNVTSIERGVDGEPLAIVAPDGQRTKLTLNANGYLNSVTNPAGEAYEMEYTPDGLLTQFTDPVGNSNDYGYDELGRFVEDTDPLGGGWTIARADSATGYTVSMTTGEGRTSSFEVEPLANGNRLQTNTAPNGTQSATLFGLDDSTTTLTADGTGVYSIAGPDPRFGMLSSVPTINRITTPAGLINTTTTARSAILTDPLDRLSHTSLTETVTTNGRVSTQVYTAATKTFVTTSPFGRQTSTVLDAKGRVAQTLLPGINPVNYAYDIRGRLSSIGSGFGAELRQTTMAYNLQGYLASSIDAEGRQTSYQYDLAGRVTRQTLPDNRVIAYTYDANGNLTSLTPPGQPAHLFEYTPVNLADKYIPPSVPGVSTPATHYQFNLDKQPTLITRPDGQALSFSYGPTSGQLLSLTTPTRSYGYTYNSTTGQLSSITSSDGGALAFTYDGFLPLSETWSGTVAGSVSQVFDGNFRITQQLVNDANSINFSYDTDDLLTAAGSLTLSRNAQNGLLTGTVLGSTVTTQTYNSFGEVEEYIVNQSEATVFGDTVTRDLIGRITHKVQIVQGTSTTSAYEYDPAGRLIEVTEGTTTTTYSYDSNSNRTHVNGVLLGTYDDQDRLVQYGSNAYSYTANGELLTKTDTVNSDVTNYTYDVLGNLTAVTLPSSDQIEYVIDGSNRRIGKKVNGTLQQGFLYSGQLNIVAELDGSGTLVSRFVYADKANVPAYMIKGGVTYRIISDHLGSPRLVINTTTGTVTQRMDYDVFGNVMNDTNPGFQPFGFAGGLYDQHTKLTRFGARDYDAETGRWTSKDPIQFDGDDSNLFGYVAQNPISSIDPTGQCVTCAMQTINWSRNIFNRKVNNVADVAGWTEYSPDMAIYHTQGEGNKNNRKYVSPDGHHEAVFDCFDNLVTSALNGGTYNYFDAEFLGGVPHAMIDVMPYLMFGSSPTDMMNPQRLITTKNALMDKLDTW